MLLCSAYLVLLESGYQTLGGDGERGEVPYGFRDGV